MIFWEGWPGLWTFFAHHELFGIPPLKNPLNSESLKLGLIQAIKLLLILFLIFIFIIKTPKRKLIDDAEKYLAETIDFLSSVIIRQILALL